MKPTCNCGIRGKEANEMLKRFLGPGDREAADASASEE